MESVWSVSGLSTESVGSRRELVSNLCSHRRRDATRQFRRVGVGVIGMYWALKGMTERKPKQHKNKYNATECYLKFTDMTCKKEWHSKDIVKQTAIHEWVMIT